MVYWLVIRNKIRKEMSSLAELFRDRGPPKENVCASGPSPCYNTVQLPSLFGSKVTQFLLMFLRFRVIIKRKKKLRSMRHSDLQVSTLQQDKKSGSEIEEPKK